MRVLVRYFAAARERSGTTEEWIEVEESATLAGLWSLLVQRHPALAGLGSCISFAVNREYTDRLHTLRDGDEVALIPPVSGGSTGGCIHD